MKKWNFLVLLMLACAVVFSGCNKDEPENNTDDTEQNGNNGDENEGDDDEGKDEEEDGNEDGDGDDTDYYVIKAVLESGNIMDIDSVYAYIYNVDSEWNINDKLLIASAPFVNNGFEIKLPPVTDEMYFFSPIDLFVGESFAPYFTLSDATAKSTLEVEYAAIKNGEIVGVLSSWDAEEEIEIFDCYNTKPYQLKGEADMIIIKVICDIDLKEGWDQMGTFTYLDRFPVEGGYITDTSYATQRKWFLADESQYYLLKEEYLPRNVIKRHK